MKKTEAKRKIKIENIMVNDSPQIRVTNNSATIADYTEHWKQGGTFPPIVVFGKNGCYYLGDGFARVESAKKAGKDTIVADIRPGGPEDALIFALSANATQGLPRTREDRRNAVKTALCNYPEYSAARIAKLCLVGDGLDAQVRFEIVMAIGAALSKYPTYNDDRIARACGLSEFLVALLRPKIENESKPAVAKGNQKPGDKPAAARKVVGMDGKRYSVKGKPPGIPARDWTPSNKPPQEGVVVSEETKADPGISVDDTVEALREMAVKLNSEGERLIQRLQRLLDDLKAGRADERNPMNTNAEPSRPSPSKLESQEPEALPLVASSTPLTPITGVD